MAIRHRPPIRHRPAPPTRAGGTLLTGPEATGILDAALAEAGGLVVTCRVTQVDHQPERGSTAAYLTRVRWPDGRMTEERFGAYTGPPPAGSLTVGDGTDRVAVWRLPHDPYLPGLATAYHPSAVAGLIRGFGLGGGPVRRDLRAYRPRRRAVVEVTGPAGRLFLKVVRPARVAALHRTHRLLSAAGVPVAPSLGHTPEGLLVLQQLPGRTLRQAVRAGVTRLPSGQTLLDLLDRLPAELAAGPARASWLSRAGHYAAVVADLLPDRAEQARQLAAAIQAEGGTGPTVPVHGDFYESQLQVAAGRVTGLLDVDTAGPGERLDDLACLLGHLSVLARLEPARAAAIGRLGARYLAAFERAVDPVDLRYRVAAVVLSLATGPHRVQERGWRRATGQRLDLAEQWLASARQLAARPAGPSGGRKVAKGSLTPVTERPHPDRRW
jgi:hypothetical protein